MAVLKDPKAIDVLCAAASAAAVDRYAATAVQDPLTAFHANRSNSLLPVFADPSALRRAETDMEPALSVSGSAGANHCHSHPRTTGLLRSH